MAIPDYQSLMLPVLKIAGDGNEHRISDVVDKLAADFNLTEAEQEELLPSGKQPTFNNRVHWAKTIWLRQGWSKRPVVLSSRSQIAVVPCLPKTSPELMRSTFDNLPSSTPSLVVAKNPTSQWRK